jgi:uncharacterized protein YukE
MADKVTVVTGALRAEAKKWDALADRMQPIADAAKTLTLGPLAFFAGVSPDFLAHSSAYDKFQASVVKVLGEAVTEFRQLGFVLNRVANDYDATDEKNAQDLDKIYSM